jgi:hypothetical protein
MATFSDLARLAGVWIKPDGAGGHYLLILTTMDIKIFL